MTIASRNGLLILHGNRLELLAEAVFEWLAAHPLPPLEPEILLVQSNGMAEWLKIELARAQGVCAATRVELPARFIWRAYRAVLGQGAVPIHSVVDKLPLTWRLMSLLPDLASEAGFEPVAAFMQGGDALRRLQLAQRLADLFDQYQVYRSDWLHDWAQGRDVLCGSLLQGHADASAVPADQAWQPALWRALLQTLAPAERQVVRGALHQRFLQALQGDASTKDPVAQAFPGLPRRFVLFGTTHVPHQTLEAIVALSAHCQVLMAVPNPCRYHWADTIDGRELLRSERRRQALRGERDLRTVAMHEMYAHGHPLLAAWGRQSRDFVRQLDAFDDAQAARRHFEVPRVDLFDEAPGDTLLQQVQAAIRDLVPLAEHPKRGAADEDRSIVFHVTHSLQREVEILHDQLLQLLAHPPEDEALNPRDIVVMVPDIDAFAPAIRSVFGQHDRRDARYIPWGIADQKDRGRQPLLVALEWLLRAPHQRYGASEVRDLVDVPAVAARFGFRAQSLPRLVAWVEGAGVRWGLNEAQRGSLGLAASGDQNTWAFGLRRMLLGYATGELVGAQGFAGVEPYAEVAGLEAGLAGSLAELLDVLVNWWAIAEVRRTPAAWAEQLRSLLAVVFEATDDAERAMLAALDHALAAWLQACEQVGFEDAVELTVAREAWLGAVDEPRISQRFKAGGVTFCTLLPLRAIPFEVVCLLGMNEGDYPRRGIRSDFDLMARPGQARPGDRSRRDDDRQLMLDALLSARRVLYVSWCGRSVRDNQVQPPSVLVSQLRDYLTAGWGAGVLGPRSTEHPLQPFSRRYFEASVGQGARSVFTFADEWRAAHTQESQDKTLSIRGDAAHPHERDVAAAPVSIQGLASFLRNPVKAFFRQRLQVQFDERDAAGEDDEPFGSEGLDRWALMNEVVQACRRRCDIGNAMEAQLADEDFVLQEVARLQRAGRLPMAGPGRRAAAALYESLLPMWRAWRSALQAHPVLRVKLPLRWGHPEDASLVFDDWLVGLRAASDDALPVWVELQAGKLARKGSGKKALPAPRPDRLLPAWVRCLASAACACPIEGIVIGEGVMVKVTAPGQDEARAVLADLMLAFRDGLTGGAPFATAVMTGTEFLVNPAAARIEYEGNANTQARGERADPCLARLYPDYRSLAVGTDFEAASQRLYAPYLHWLVNHTTVHLLPGTQDEEELGDE